MSGRSRIAAVCAVLAGAGLAVCAAAQEVPSPQSPLGQSPPRALELVSPAVPATGAGAAQVPRDAAEAAAEAARRGEPVPPDPDEPAATPTPAPAPGGLAAAVAGPQALAIEEARLRERMVMALAVAESVRLRGRTILVAMNEIARVKERIDTIDPGSRRRAEFEERLAALESRRVALDREVDEEFVTYLALVSDLAAGVWSRVDRVGGGLRDELAEMRLTRMRSLYPFLHAHVGEFARSGSVTREMTDRWRREIDDTIGLRRERARALAGTEPSGEDAADTEEDI